MKQNCKNSKNKTYTGKENTPLGMGYHAEGEKLDKKMKGKNGHMYKVNKIKSGKRWFKIKALSSPIKRTSRGDLPKVGRIVHWMDGGSSGVRFMLENEDFEHQTDIVNEETIKPGDVAVLNSEGWDQDIVEGVGYIVFKGPNAVNNANKFVEDYANNHKEDDDDDENETIIVSSWDEIVNINVWHY
jgi:hypothetical protein